MSESNTDRLAALLAEHEYGAGSQGRFCRCGAMGVGDRQKNHAAHLAAVLTAAGVGFVAEAEERDEFVEALKARAEKAEAALADLRSRVEAVFLEGGDWCLPYHCVDCIEEEEGEQRALDNLRALLDTEGDRS